MNTLPTFAQDQEQTRTGTRAPISGVSPPTDMRRMGVFAALPGTQLWSVSRALFCWKRGSIGVTG
jgi:hypothetical protein